jgi:hypothetical protein
VPVSNDGGRKGFQVLLGVLGTVMIVAGSLTLLFGASIVPGEGNVSPDVDSEMRFYAVWYVVAGALLLRTIPRVELETGVIRLIAAAFFVAGCARALSWAVEGRPSSFAIALMVVELVIPFVVFWWQLVLARRASAINTT